MEIPCSQGKVSEEPVPQILLLLIQTWSLPIQHRCLSDSAGFYTCEGGCRFPTGVADRTTDNSVCRRAVGGANYSSIGLHQLENYLRIAGDRSLVEVVTKVSPLGIHSGCLERTAEGQTCKGLSRPRLHCHLSLLRDRLCQGLDISQSTQSIHSFRLTRTETLSGATHITKAALTH